MGHTRCGNKVQDIKACLTECTQLSARATAWSEVLLFQVGRIQGKDRGKSIESHTEPDCCTFATGIATLRNEGFGNTRGNKFIEKTVLPMMTKEINSVYKTTLQQFAAALVCSAWANNVFLPFSHSMDKDSGDMTHLQEVVAHTPPEDELSAVLSVGSMMGGCGGRLAEGMDVCSLCTTVVDSGGNNSNTREQLPLAVVR